METILSLNKSFILGKALSFFVFYCLIINSAQSHTYLMPEGNNSLIGELQYTRVLPGENLADVSRRFGVGVLEMIHANPLVHPWLPKPRSEVVIPSLFMLPPGSRKGIVINIAELRLYYYHPDGSYVSTYPLSIGKMGWATPTGRTYVVRKEENPTWRVPKSILEEKEEEGIFDFPSEVPPGPDNPLGNHAIYIGFHGYLIHGTNRTKGIGLRVSHGCIRLSPTNIEELFEMVTPRTPVRIIHEPFKFGWDNDTLYFEAHKPLEDEHLIFPDEEIEIQKAATKGSNNRPFSVSWDSIYNFARIGSGIPVKIGTQTGYRQSVRVNSPPKRSFFR